VIQNLEAVALMVCAASWLVLFIILLLAWQQGRREIVRLRRDLQVLMQRHYNSDGRHESQAIAEARSAALADNRLGQR
jgi:hypothetical protein